MAVIALEKRLFCGSVMMVNYDLADTYIVYIILFI